MGRPLRILHTESSHGWGGQEIRILTEAHGMQARGHQVLIVTTGGAELLPAAAQLGLATAVVPMRRKGLAELLAVRRWLASRRGLFDVINTHSSTDSWLFALARATLGDATPIVRTRHVSTAVNSGWATRWLYTRATAHIVVTGEALRRQLHAQNGFALEHMTSVRTGIDLHRYRPGDRAAHRRLLNIPQKAVIGIVATLRDWKGHDYLLEAVRALEGRTDLLLLVVGDGPRRAHLEQRTDALGIRDAVRFVGNRDDVEQWLPAFDLFVLPSYGEEGVPQAIMQAMACGLPVVSTPVGAIPEVVADEQTGLLVPPRDAGALAAAIARLIGDPATCARFSAAALERAHAQFGVERMLDQMEDVFRRVATAAR